MLFFRRRDPITNSSQMNDQEKCIHTCLFFVFIVFVLTIFLFYFAATAKGSNDERLYYYIGAGVCLTFLILIVVSTIIYIQRSCSDSISSVRRVNGLTNNECNNSRLVNNLV